MITKPPFFPLLAGVLLVPWIIWVIVTPVVFLPYEDPDRIVGEWQGVSECVKATWNAACREERVIYRCERSSSGSERVVMHAGKVIGNKVVSMGDLALGFQEFANSWVGEYSNSKFHLLWQFTVHGNVMRGRLVELPSDRVIRRVTASRAKEE